VRDLYFCENNYFFYKKKLFTDSIPGVGGGNKDDDDVSKEDQVWLNVFFICIVDDWSYEIW